jgi:hypothetical protein
MANPTVKVLSWTSKSKLDNLSTIDTLLAAVHPISAHKNLESANNHVVRVSTNQAVAFEALPHPLVRNTHMGPDSSRVNPRGSLSTEFGHRNAFNFESNIT